MWPQATTLVVDSNGINPFEAASSREAGRVAVLACHGHDLPCTPWAGLRSGRKSNNLPGKANSSGLERRRSSAVLIKGGMGPEAVAAAAAARPADKDGLAEGAGARERILAAAYDLFARHGTAAVGVDAIVARAGVAKMSLYRHFRSKDELIVAFLERRRERWRVQWLEAEIAHRETAPAARLLAIFDVFDGWFHEVGFEGCSFINVLLQSERTSMVGRAAALQLAEIRAVIAKLAAEAGLAEVERFAQAWHILMKGSIVAAGEGQRDAAKVAQAMGRTVLASWPREAGPDEMVQARGG